MIFGEPGGVRSTPGTNAGRIGAARSRGGRPMCGNRAIGARGGERTAWAAIVLAWLVAGCALPLLERDNFYPASWPAIGGAIPDCGDLGGTFANKGALIDKAGDTHDIWLTSLLPFSERVPPGDPRHPERAALRSCERVTLRFEKFPWPDRPSAATWRVVVSPARKAPGEPAARWEACGGFHLPIGRGWPLDGSLSAVCLPNSYVLTADPGQILADTFRLDLARASDGSLIAKWEYGPTWAVDHVWARFERLP